MNASRLLNRLARVSREELAWRAAAAARNNFSRARAAVAVPKWDRRALAGTLVPEPGLADVRAALEGEHWQEAHAVFSRYLIESPQRFVVAPAYRERLAGRVVRECPSRVRDAVERADRILAGQFDLLGYRGLRFDASTGGLDWHVDPVHGRRAPVTFWTTVPYLDAACGDHKVIWELNRHQHWLALGRAFWLSSDPRYRARMIAELGSWLAANPPLEGINWSSMLELSFRSLSWLWALNVFVDPAMPDEAPWTIDLLVALDRQLAHVEQNLSYYFSPNTHLLGEALALYVTARALPVFAGSARREAIGRHILCQEIERQIASDGGHCERSTHYHRYTLDFYLLALVVAELSHDPVAAQFRTAVTRLASAARLLADDRGRLPHIGDDDGGDTMSVTGRATDDVRSSLAAASILLCRPDLAVGAPQEDTTWLLGHPSFEAGLDRARTLSATPHVHQSGALVETGYYVSRTPDGDHLVIDGGPHGYQNGGHAHADALSLTLTVRNVPFLIDPGTGSYTADRALRDHLRSTPCHNTLTLDGRSQSTPAGPFHWSHVADSTVVRWHAGEDFDDFVATHDGYRPIEHRRHVLAKLGDLIVVADRVAGDGRHQADVHWLVDPRWQVQQSGRRVRFEADTDAVEFVAPEGRLDVFAADASTGLGWYSPVYGHTAPATALRLRVTGDLPLWIVSVFGLDTENPVITTDVTSPSGGASIAVTVTRVNSIDGVFIHGDQVSFRRDDRRRRGDARHEALAGA